VGARRIGVWTAVVTAVALLVLCATSALAATPLLLPVGSTVSDPPPGGDGDGALEPGETAGLTERLFNPNGDAILDAAGTLSSSSSFVTVSQAVSSWPAISIGGTAGNEDLFGIALAANYVCGGSIDLDLAMTTELGPLDVPVKLLAGMGPERASVDPTLPRQIFTDSGFDSTVSVPGPGTVKNMRVRIPWLEHTYVGDVAMTLRSPSGTTVRLMDSPGKGSFGSTNKGFSDLVLTDDADTPIEELAPKATGVTGAYRPDEALSTFDGEAKAGTWTLHVWDTYTDADIGLLHSWAISPVGVDCSTAANDPPLAKPDQYTAVGAGATLHGATVLANDSDDDGDAMTALSLSSPSHGSVSLASNGTFTYTPVYTYAGPDSFTYQARDATTGSESVTVKIAVTGPSYPPPVVNVGYDLGSGTTKRGNLLDWYGDPNGDPLYFAVTGGGTVAGQLDLRPDGSFFYRAPYVDQPLLNNYFEYVVTDGHSAPVVERLYFVVWNFGSGASQPPAAPAPGPAPKTKPVELRAFANVSIERAAITGHRLKVRAAISPLASGRVKATFRSGGRVSKVRATIASGRVSFALALSARQRRARTGVLKLTYAGNALTLPESAKLTAVGRPPRLHITSALIDGSGKLRAAGTIARRARGVVRVSLTYSPRPGRLKSYDYNAKIRGGKWSLADQLPAEAAGVHAQVTGSYRGDRKHRIGGAHISQDVGS
jgi:subtilisin-like proprotein convertase family protein